MQNPVKASIFDTRPDSAISDGPVHRVLPVLTFQNVYYEQPPRRLVDFSFDLLPGQNIVFFGPENCGKDLILPLATGMVKPVAGRVFFMGQDMARLSIQELYNIRKDYGYILQDYGLINNLSVEDNILLPLRYHIAKGEVEMQKAMDQLIPIYSLDKVRTARPFVLTESEKLRVAFLRALMLEPRLIFFENIESNQDPLKLKHFLNLADRFLQADNRAFVMTTYNAEFFTGHAQHFCLLNDGKIVFTAENDITSHKDDNDYLKQYLERNTAGPIMLS